jgi:hypothetical protein
MSLDKKLFISYSRRQSEWAKQFNLKLFQSKRYFPWIDERIPTSMDWWRSICENIETCYAFVAIFTESYAQSRYCLAELEYALALNKPIIVLKADNATYPPDLEEQRIQFFAVPELSENTLTDAVMEVHATIQQIIEDYHKGVYQTQSSVVRPSVPSANNPEDVAIADTLKTLINTATLSSRAEGITLDEANTAIQAILGEPFAWCAISAGEVNIHTSAKDQCLMHVNDFYMAKFALTNRQFDVFYTTKDGWSNPLWWDFSSDAQRWHDGRKRPNATAFLGDDLPRTNLTWYDAIAFTRWLSFQSGLLISLPTEAQWQRASGGDSGFVFPWGNTFEGDKLCWSKNSNHNPAPVGAYSDGASPYGVVQMVGNVWEWCLTTWDDPQATTLTTYTSRAMRGGSWYNVNEKYFQVLGRGGNKPDNFKNNWGMRLVWHKP